VVGCWHGYLSAARCILAYGPADATASVKSGLVLLFWYRLTQVQRAVKRACVFICLLEVQWCVVCVRSRDRLELRHRIEGHQLGVISVDVNREGTVAASSSLNSQIRLWDIETGKLVKDIDAGPGV